jgi:hypothetical protein
MDQMTRQKISTLSSHRIYFTLSVSETFAADEYVIIDFGEDDSLFTVAGGSITTSDVSFYDGTSRTVQEIQTSESCIGYTGNNDMVVVVNDTAGTIKFRACSSYTESGAAATIQIDIGTTAGGVDRITNPSTVGSAEIQFIAGYGSGDWELDVPIMDDDQVSIMASVDTYILFDLDISDGSHSNTDAPYEVSLGELTYTTITDEDTTGVSEIYIELDSNASSGVEIQVKSVGGSNGLVSSSVSDNIPSGEYDLTGTSTYGGYGLSATSVSGLNVSSGYNKGAGNVGGLSTDWQEIYTVGNPVAGALGQVNVRARAGTLTSAANDYTDVITFRAIGTF